MPGKRQVFSDEENEVLRAALRKLRDERRWTQAHVGKLLNMKQQNAGRLLGRARTGMSRDAANLLARELGYRDAEHLLLERGVLAEMKQAPSGASWIDRDIAVSIARKYGYDESVIQAVVSRYMKPEHRLRPMKWWNDQIVLEALANRIETPPPLPPPAVAAPAPRRRKRAVSE